MLQLHEAKGVKVKNNESASHLKPRHGANRVGGPHPSLLSVGAHEIEFKVENATGTAPLRNKIFLVVMHALFVPNALGLDRCYMGQFTLGVIKGCTLGGLGVWSLIDYSVILVNALSESASIDTIGFYARFSKSEELPAFIIAVVHASLIALSVCCGVMASFSLKATTPMAQTQIERGQIRDLK